MHPLATVAPVWIDHVVVAVADVDAAGEQLAADHGLDSYPTRAPAGLAARVVPCGAGYLHLFDVEDEAKAWKSPLGAAVVMARQERRLLASWAVATHSIEPFVRRSGLGVARDGLDAADGSPLELTALRPGSGLQGALPVIVCWEVGVDDRPERQPVRHRVDPLGITCIDVAVDPVKLRQWLGPAVDDLPLRLRKGTPGLRAVTVATAAADVVLGEPDGQPARAVPAGSETEKGAATALRPNCDQGGAALSP